MQRQQQRSQADVQVEGQAPVANVIEIYSQLARQYVADIAAAGVVRVQQGGFIAELQLRQSGDARAQVEDAALPLVVGIDEAGVLRPGANHAHIALEHVEQLRQLIKAQLPEPASGAGDPVVISRRYPDPGKIGAGNHGAELVHGERTSAAAGADGAVEDGAGGRGFHEEGGEQRQRYGEYQTYQRQKDIRSPLQSYTSIILSAVAHSYPELIDDILD